MEVERRVLKDGAVRRRVRWRQGGRRRSQSSDRKGDAVTFAAELRRRQQLGTLTSMEMGRVTLGEYVVGTWCEVYASQLSPKTWMQYRQLLNKHILPSLGQLELRSIRPETIARWQAERLAAGNGRVSVRYALTLLGASSSARSRTARSSRTLRERCARRHSREGQRFGRWRQQRSNGCARRARRATRR
jgi:Phage integrase, N-terminal SAM-like domain